MEQVNLLSKQLALSCQENIALQQKLEVTEKTVRSTQRELDRQRGSDNGIIAAKVKAEEALRVTSHGKYETRKSFQQALHT